VDDQVGAERLLERGRERLDQLVRQLADEADGVGEQVAAPGDLERARCGVERVEEALAHAHVGAR
jgi:ribose 1,5-bisphosphokinase PhnN